MKLPRIQVQPIVVKKTINFIEEFGTHYTKKTFFGATLTLESRWTSSAKSGSQRSANQKCVANAYSKSISESAGVPGIFSTSSTTNFKTEDQECKKNSDNSGYFSSNKMSETNIVARGASFSTDPDVWTASCEKHHVPIDYELKNISSIFKKGWINHLKDNNGNDIDGAFLATYLDSITQNYCEYVLGLGHDCDIQNGCGINGVCPEGKVCVSNSTIEKGYKCVEEGVFILNFFFRVPFERLEIEVHEGVYYEILSLELEAGERLTIYGNKIKTASPSSCQFQIHTPGAYNLYENCIIVESTDTEIDPEIKIVNLSDTGYVSCSTVEGSKNNNQIKFTADLTLQIGQQYSIIADLLYMECIAKTPNPNLTSSCSGTIEKPGLYGVDNYTAGGFCAIYHVVN